ncbi:MAG: response regulator [Desulfosarcinaceae bacterium]|jgi:twitching motility two-component system response regulator PilH
MSQKVLVVDDDPDVQLFSVTVLEENGFTPLTANDGHEGMEIIRQELPALVILDVLMPRESGIKLYRTLRTETKYKSIPVIVLSGISKRSFLRSQNALSEFGGDAVPEPNIYLEKPVEPEELAKAIKSVLG